IPFKKPKKKELTKQEKRYNKKQRKARVIVEHTISRMKKFRIMAEEFRNRLTRYDRMTSIVCGLVNFTTQSE
ncbi:MAG: transposase family protein, partial [Candidatus Thermoplasmatota archaeon]